MCGRGLTLELVATRNRSPYYAEKFFSRTNQEIKPAAIVQRAQLGQKLGQASTGC